MNASTAVFPGLKRVALLGASALLWLPGVGQAEETTIRFQLDWRFEGPSAPFLLAESRGYFAEEGLDVQIDSGSGSAGAINRVARVPIDGALVTRAVEFLLKTLMALH